MCPPGNEELVSNGGTVSDWSGWTRPVKSFPAAVIASDPAVATTMNATGVQPRHRHVNSTVTTVAMIGSSVGPQRSVNQVITVFRAGVRCATIQSSTGRSIRDNPSLSLTESYVAARPGHCRRQHPIGCHRGQQPGPAGGRSRSGLTGFDPTGRGLCLICARWHARHLPHTLPWSACREFLAAIGSPTVIGEIGEPGIAVLIADGSPRLARTLPGRIVTALAAQSVTTPGTQQYGRVIRGLAEQLSTVLGQRDTLRDELEELLAAHPPWPRSSPRCPVSAPERE